VLRKKIDLPWDLRERIAFDIAKGMEYLASSQPPVVHRDLRSPNIFIVSLDVFHPVIAKIGDFGLSQHVSPHLVEILPTWQWLAPEVFSPEKIGRASCRERV